MNGTRSSRELDNGTGALRDRNGDPDPLPPAPAGWTRGRIEFGVQEYSCLLSRRSWVGWKHEDVTV